MEEQNRPGPSDSTEREGAPTSPGQDEEIPLGQRLYERPFLLLILGIVVMVVFYTGWGLWEVMSLSEAPLP
jgi:hypothetical protein